MHCHPVHHVDSYDLGWIHARGTLMYLLYGIPEILTYDIINEFRFSDNVATMKGKVSLESVQLWHCMIPTPARAPWSHGAHTRWFAAIADRLSCQRLRVNSMDSWWDLANRRCCFWLKKPKGIWLGSARCMGGKEDSLGGIVQQLWGQSIWPCGLIGRKYIMYVDGASDSCGQQPKINF